jgi:hypothetical protein
MSEENNKNWFKQSLPIVGTVLTVLTFFADGFPIWVTTSAVVVGMLLVLSWLFSEAGWLGKAIRLRWFRSKLSKEQAVRLSVLLDDISNQMSYSYTSSPFYVWRNCSNKYSKYFRFNDSYYGCVTFWLNDLKDKFNDPGVNNLPLLNSLSKSVSEASKLAEYAEKELEELLRNKEVTDQERARILKEWDSAKNHFNHWIDKWRTLFKEINKTTNVNCIEYFRSLEMIG